MKRQINEIKVNQNKQIVLLDQQINKLENIIKKVKKNDKKNVEDQRNVVDQLKKFNKKQQDKYKQIS